MADYSTDEEQNTNIPCCKARGRKESLYCKMHYTPWDIAEACVYLAGPSGRFVTGETLDRGRWGQLWAETWTTGKPEYFGDEKG